MILLPDKLTVMLKDFFNKKRVKFSIFMRKEYSMNTKSFILTMCCILMFSQIGFAGERIGIVDIQSIVSNSGAVKALKQEHSAKLQSLNAIITEAQNALANENDPQKIIMLQDKYNTEFNRKKEIIDNQYQTKLSEIEAQLKRDITESARKNNYDIVIAKSVVFYGGEDITDLISKDIK